MVVEAINVGDRFCTKKERGRLFAEVMSVEGDTAKMERWDPKRKRGGRTRFDLPLAALLHAQSGWMRVPVNGQVLSTIRTISAQANELQQLINRGEFATVGENILADRMIELANLVGVMASVIEKVAEAQGLQG